MWRCAAFSLPVEARCHVVGILNVSSRSRTHHTGEAALARARQMVGEGADVIEVGGASARPGATPIPAAQEEKDLVPLVKSLAAELPVPIAVDTQKARIAGAALEAGASIVNDITSLADPAMAGLLAGSTCGIVLMHMRGTPETMQVMTEYEDVVAEVASYLKDRAALAESAGMERERIAIDAGLGLAKNRHQSLSLVKGTQFLAKTGYPVMVAASRKSFIGRTLNRPPAKRLMGTLAIVAWSVAAGAALVRVHDVKEAVRVVRMTEAILSAAPHGPV